MLKIFLIPAFLLCITSSVFAQTSKSQELKNAWQLFFANKRVEALDAFKAIPVSNKEERAEADLGSSMVYREMDKINEAVKSFQSFYKGSSSAYAAAASLWNTEMVVGYDNEKTKPRLDFLNTIINDKTAPGSLKIYAYAGMGYHFQGIGDFKKSEEFSQKIGVIDNWQITGTFDNTAGGGFDNEYGVLQNPKADAVFKNDVGANVTWFNAGGLRNDKWLDFKHHFSFSNSVMFAQTFVNSLEAKEAYLMVGVSGTAKIWVNDKIVISEPVEKNTDMDYYNVKIKLNAGYNRVLVQVSENEAGRASFVARICDESGTSLKLPSSNVYQDYQKDNSTELAQRVSYFAEKHFKNKLQSDPKDYVNLILLSELYLRNDNAHEAYAYLKKALEIAPNCSYTNKRMLECYSRLGNNTDYTRVQDKIKENDPDNYLSLEIKYSDAFKKEDYKLAASIVEQLVSIYGVSENTEMKELNVAAKNQETQDKLLDMINTLYKKYPKSYSMLTIKYIIETNGSKDIEKGNDVLKKYLKLVYSDVPMTTLASNYFKLGKINEGYDIYFQRQKNFPYNISHIEDIAKLYFSQEDYAQALKWYAKTIELAPFHGYYHQMYGSVLEALGKKQEAIESYKKSIYFEPTNYQSRKLLARLQDKKNLFEYFDEQNADEIYKNSLAADKYPEDNSIILLNDKKKAIYEGGASVEQTELVIKVFNQAGIDIWKEYNVGYNQYTQRLIIDKAEVIKSDGSHVAAEENGGYLVFTSLEAGDAIHILYKIENYYTGNLSSQFWDKFHFNYFIPSGSSRYSLILPENQNFDFKMINSDIKPVITQEDGYKKYVWELKDSPSIKSEPFMPNSSDIGVVLEVSSIKDWNFIANWYKGLSATKIINDIEVKEIVADLFKDKKNLNEMEKVRVIYDYILKNISYSSVTFMQSALVPKKASQTINAKLGDCKDMSVLFVAMAKELGISANLVLVDSRENGERDLLLPSISFNHCIARVKVDNKDYFVELTDPKLSFSTIPYYNENSLCLVIPKENEAFTSDLIYMNTVNKPENKSIRETNIVFTANDLTAVRKTYKTGDCARSTRKEFADIGKEQQEKDMSQAIGSGFKTPIKLNSLAFYNLTNLTDTVSYNYSFTSKNNLTDFASIKMTTLPWADSDNLSEYFSADSRKYPMNTWEFFGNENEKEVMTIEIPKGKVMAETPKTVKLDNKFVDYSLTYEIKENKLIATRNLKLKQKKIATTEYEEFKTTLSSISEADNKQIGFKDQAAAAPAKPPVKK